MNIKYNIQYIILYNRSHLFPINIHIVILKLLYFMVVSQFLILIVTFYFIILIV